MKILVDMNLSPAWLPLLRDAGFDAVHWSAVGAPNAPDAELFAWARQNNCIIFTHDLDLRRVLDASPSLIFLHDKGFRLILANRAYLERAGVSGGGVPTERYSPKAAAQSPPTAMPSKMQKRQKKKYACPAVKSSYAAARPYSTRRVTTSTAATT